MKNIMMKGLFFKKVCFGIVVLRCWGLENTVEKKGCHWLFYCWVDRYVAMGWSL